MNLKAIKERLEKATPGPEILEVFLLSEWPSQQTVSDRDFLEHAAEDITVLVAEVERLREENEKMRGYLRSEYL